VIWDYVGHSSVRRTSVPRNQERERESAGRCRAAPDVLEPAVREWASTLCVTTIASFRARLLASKSRDDVTVIQKLRFSCRHVHHPLVIRIKVWIVMEAIERVAEARWDHFDTYCIWEMCYSWSSCIHTSMLSQTNLNNARPRGDAFTLGLIFFSLRFSWSSEKLGVTNTDAATFSFRCP